MHPCRWPSGCSQEAWEERLCYFHDKVYKGLISVVDSRSAPADPQPVIDALDALNARSSVIAKAYRDVEDPRYPPGGPPANILRGRIPHGKGLPVD